MWGAPKCGGPGAQAPVAPPLIRRCVFPQQTNISPLNWRINIRLNGQTFRFKERTIFATIDLSQRAADNILPQRVNVLPQCLYDFYEYILPATKFKF